METQVQQPEYIDTTPEAIEASQSASLAMLPPAQETEQQWQQIGSQVSVFLAQLPNYLGRFFETYKQPITSIALIVAAIVAVKIVFAVLDTLNDIPLLAPTFELIGIGYSVWFVSRYMLTASNRQEISRQFEALKQQVIGSQS